MDERQDLLVRLGRITLARLRAVDRTPTQTAGRQRLSQPGADRPGPLGWQEVVRVARHGSKAN